MSATQAYKDTRHKLDQLFALKQQIYYNFPCSTEQERYAMIEIITTVMERTETFSEHLRERMLMEELTE